MTLEKIDFEKLEKLDSNELEKLKNAMINVGFFKICNYGLRYGFFVTRYKIQLKVMKKKISSKVRHAISSNLMT